MALWHGPASIFGRGMKFVSHGIAQYHDGKSWVVGGLADDGKLYYFTRIWKDGKTVESEPQLISDKIFPGGGTSDIFVSEKDGYFQFSVSTKGGIVHFWAKPEEIFPRPPIPPYDPIVKDLCGGYLGIQLDWLANASAGVDQKKDAKERITDFLLYGASLGIREIDCFRWLSSGNSEHKHLNYIIPWVYDSAKNKFNMAIDNEEFYDLENEFLEMVNYAKIKPRLHGVMAQSYSRFPFTKNVQGTNGLWDSRNWPYIGHSFDRLGKSMNEICEHGFEVKIANEPAHRGSSNRWHSIMYFHEIMFETYLKKWMPLSSVVCDRTACEGTTSELIGIQECGKPRNCDRDKRHGKPEYARRLLKKDSVWAETHGVSTLDDLLETSCLAFMWSGWAKYILHEDGGSETKTGEGSTWYGLNFASPDQAYDMGIYLWKLAKDKNKTAKYCWFPIESLSIVDGIVRERYHIDLKDGHGNSIWDKPKALIQANKEIYR